MHPRFAWIAWGYDAQSIIQLTLGNSVTKTETKTKKWLIFVSLATAFSLICPKGFFNKNDPIFVGMKDGSLHRGPRNAQGGV